MAMMTPDSRFTFGKYKGRTIKEVAAENPSYLCWMRLTGFADFGKEVTEAIFAWEEENPKEVKRIQANIDKKKAEERKSAAAVDDHAPISDPVPMKPSITANYGTAWGSW